jgi:hypothetical protein
MPEAFVVEAALALTEGCDSAAVGGAVTVELCGSWDHEGPCRWPHNSAIDPEAMAESERELAEHLLAGPRAKGQH